MSPQLQLGWRLQHAVACTTASGLAISSSQAGEGDQFAFAAVGRQHLVMRSLLLGDQACRRQDRGGGAVVLLSFTIVRVASSLAERPKSSWKPIRIREIGRREL